ncbi:hypothetical protein HG531_007244 [Fusarium graminearum]|nr:hypothetical protein HG531_007244 [Fusarium graminearum]
MLAQTRNRENETLTLLIRNIIRDLQQVHITKRHAHVLSLPTSESTGEMRVTKHAREEAVAASNLERSNVASADINACNTSTDLINDTAELVAQDVTLGELDDCAVEEMQVGTADGAACDSEDDIAVFNNLWLGSVNCGEMLVFNSVQSLHGLAMVARLLVRSDILRRNSVIAVADDLFDASYRVISRVIDLVHSDHADPLLELRLGGHLVHPHQLGTLRHSRIPAHASHGNHIFALAIICNELVLGWATVKHQVVPPRSHRVAAVSELCT